VRHGFTLIELMVVVVVSMILVVIGVVAMTRYLAREHVVSARSEILSSIRLARNYAVTDQKPTGFNLDYVAVALTADGQLTVWPVNLVSGSGPSYFTKDVSSDDVTVTPVNYGDLLFSVSDGKLLMPGGAAPVAADYVLSVWISSTQAVVWGATAVSVDAGGKIW
jgi:Tfp pilus assembly protein FimT